MVAVDPLNQNWNLIRLPVIIVIVWSFIGFISCFPISPLMFMFFCYQSHTVCLHLLVLFCNNNPSYLCSSSVLFFNYFLMLLFVVHLFLCLVFSTKKRKRSVGWPNFMFDVACLIVVFLLFVFAHVVTKFLKYKIEMVTWRVLGFSSS